MYQYIQKFESVPHLVIQIDDELSTAPENQAFNQAFENVIAGGKIILVKTQPSLTQSFFSHFLRNLLSRVFIWKVSKFKRLHFVMFWW